jgi:hypothetical protein
LVRSSRIDCAAGVSIPKNAIAAGFFDETVVVTDAAHELRGELVQRLAAEFGKRPNLFG